MDRLSIISLFDVIWNSFIKQTINIVLFMFFYIFLETNILHSKESHNFWLSFLSEKKIGTLQLFCNNINLPANNLLLLLYNFINYFITLFVNFVFLL